MAGAPSARRYHFPHMKGKPRFYMCLLGEKVKQKDRLTVKEGN